MSYDLSMAQTQWSNELYLVVMPMISLANGKAEQYLTLMGGKDFATEFFPDEVGQYELMFKNRTQYFEGGHVKGYEFNHEPTDSGRVIVKVTQNVG